jgi:integrase
MPSVALAGLSREDLISEIERLRHELAEEKLQRRTAAHTSRDQARAILHLTDDCPDWAPTLACLYWLYGPSRWHEPNWRQISNRLQPVISDIGEVPAPKVTPMLWDAHRARRRLQPSAKTGQPVSEVMLNRELERAKEMLDWAVRNALIKFNPIKSAKRVPAISRRETWLPPLQIDQLLDGCEFIRDDRLGHGGDDGRRAKIMRAFVLATHDSMLRPGEARTLLRDRIGSDGRVELAARQTKSRKRRIVFLTPRTLEAIRAIPPEANCPFVMSLRGVVMPERTISKLFRRLCELAGVDAFAAPGDRRIHAHDLRASGASTADENGARATAIRDAL